MSAELNTDGLRRLACALAALTRMTNETGVAVSAYAGSYVEIDEHQIRITWNADERTYTAEWPDST